MIILDGHSPETENKRICQISGQKSGCSCLRSGHLRDNLPKPVVDRETFNRYLRGKWSLTCTRSVRYERLDCIYFCFYHFCHNMISTKMLSMRTRYLGNNIVRVLVLFTFTGNVSKCKYLKFYSLEMSSPYFSSGIV